MAVRLERLAGQRLGSCQQPVGRDTDAHRHRQQRLQRTFDVEVETGEQTLYTLVTVTPPPCVGEGGGIAFLGVSGGAQPYEADWFGINPMDIPPGTYSVLVTDGNGCEVEDEFVIPETGTLELAAEATNISCFGALDWQHRTRGHPKQW